MGKISASNKPINRSSKRSGRVLFYTLLIILILFVGMGIGWAISTYNTNLSFTTVIGENQENEAMEDPVLLQITKRFEDGFTFLKITLTWIGIIASFIGIALGFSIWETREYAQRLIDEKFWEFKEERIEPLIKESFAELSEFSSQGLLLQVDASTLLLKGIFDFTQEMYKRQLENKELSSEDIANLLETREEYYQATRNVTRYLIASLSRVEADVQDQCQKLRYLAEEGSETVISRADQIIVHMQGLLEAWPHGQTRLEIQRLIDTLERKTESK